MSVGDCIGRPSRVEWRGTVYTVGRLVPAAVAEIEAHIAETVWAEACELESAAPGARPAAWKRLVAREYRAGGPLWRESLAGPRGRAIQLWGMMVVLHPDLTVRLVQDMWKEIGDALELALVLNTPGLLDEPAEESASEESGHDIPGPFRLHATLLLEPWGKLPGEVAGLDVSQVRQLYVRAAEARRERMKRMSSHGGDGLILSEAEEKTAFLDAVRTLRPNSTDAELEHAWNLNREGEPT